MQQPQFTALFVEYFGVYLQALTIAAIGAAAVLLVLRLIRPTVDTGVLPPKTPWFARDQRNALALAALLALGSRVVLTVLAYAVVAPLNGWGSPLPPLSSIWSRWDAPHYLDIARIGYTADKSLGDQWLFIVFYPLFPALTALLKPLFGDEFNASIVISWASLAGACYWMYRLSLQDNDKKEAWRAVKYLLIFPAAVFLGTPYTESLFLLLSVLCLYALRRRCWWLAGVTGFLAALTRNVGVLLAVPFIVELLDSLGLFADWKRIRTGEFWRGALRGGLWVMLIPLALGVYLLINWVVYGDPLMFLKIQKDHWGQQAQPIYKTVLGTWSCLVGDRPVDEKIFMWAPQLTGMVALLFAAPILVRRLRPAHMAYLLVYLVVALMPSWLLSFNRYMMGAVPLFLGIAAFTRHKWADITLTVIFTIVMFILTAGFIMWKMVV